MELGGCCLVNDRWSAKLSKPTEKRVTNKTGPRRAQRGKKVLVLAPGVLAVTRPSNFWNFHSAYRTMIDFSR